MERKPLPTKSVVEKPAEPSPLTALISRPVRKGVRTEAPSRFKYFLEWLLLYFPDLKKKLAQAAMPEEPIRFIEKALLSALIYTLIIIILLWVVLNTAGRADAIILLAPLFILLFPVMFIYWMQLPEVKRRMREREIDKELVFAGRHLLIGLRGGIPLFDAMVGITKDYGEVSKEFNKIVEKISLGVPADLAMHEVAENNPSSAFNRVIMQLVNSLRSGSDVANALEAVLDQISKEQAIALKAYGQKLNPLVMFFMLFGIVLPSLGVAFIIVLLSLIGGGQAALGVSALLAAFILTALIQFIFLTGIESSRPKFDIS